MAEYRAEQESKEEERKAEFERQQQEYEAEQARREKQRKARLATFDRILDQAPAVFTAAQLRLFLRFVVYIAPHSFLEEVASHVRGRFVSQSSSKSRRENPLRFLPALIPPGPGPRSPAAPQKTLCSIG